MILPVTSLISIPRPNHVVVRVVGGVLSNVTGFGCHFIQ